jgi:hypothetical protein
MAGAFRAPGSELDEGILVSFPDRMLHGALPYRDFESFYGPANAGVTAAAFKLFGSSLYVERAVGLVFRLLLVLAVFLIGRRFSRAAALGGMVVAAAVVARSVVADAEYEAISLALLGIIATTRATYTSRGAYWALGGGLLAGFALLFRLELIVGVVIGAIPLLLATSSRRRLYWTAGLLLTLLAYVPLAVAAGPDKLRLNLNDLRATGHDRRLPVPPLTSSAGLLLLVAILATGVVLAVGVSVWSGTGDLRGRILVAAGVLAANGLPFGFWRADGSHIVAASLVPLAVLPMAAAATGIGRRHAWFAGAIAGIAVLMLASTRTVRGDLRANVDFLRSSARAYSVSYHGRSFPIASLAAATDLRRMVRIIGSRAARGDRLFIGPEDLRRTNFNDAFVYYLLPQLNPASFYIELDPPASRSGSRLPRDLQSADYLLLTSRWNGWDEPNPSRRYRSPAANLVVSRHFCLVVREGRYVLLRRCR